jgi:hypothetical protein
MNTHTIDFFFVQKLGFETGLLAAKKNPGFNRVPRKTEELDVKRCPESPTGGLFLI